MTIDDDLTTDILATNLESMTSAGKLYFAARMVKECGSFDHPKKTAAMLEVAYFTARQAAEEIKARLRSMGVELNDG